jgi:hypothetical protein
MPDLKARFVIDVGGTKRELFSAIEKEKTGDVILVLKSALSTGPSPHDPNGVEIAEQRISLHPSPDSPDHTTVKQTLALRDGQVRTMVLLTRGPKAGRFGAVLERRSIHLHDERYLLTESRSKNAEIIDIGNYDPESSTLFWGIYVGCRDVTFDAVPSKKISIHQHCMAGFRIVLLSSLSDFPSYRTCGTCNFFSAPVDQHPHAADGINRTMDGFSATDCIQFHQICKSHLIKEFVEQVSPKNQNTAVLLDKAYRDALHDPVLVDLGEDVTKQAVQMRIREIPSVRR